MESGRDAYRLLFHVIHYDDDDDDHSGGATIR